MNVRILTLAMCFPASVMAQGFAGLGNDVDGFTTPQHPAQISFPQDHGAHPDFRIEWWYLTANLKGVDGTDYGLQWTLFRSATQPFEVDGFESPQLWLAHAAVTTPDAHYVTERAARGGTGQAGVQAAPFEAWIDEWQLSGDLEGVANLRAAGPDFGYDMLMQAKGPLVMQGDQGYSVKSSAGQASYYYSQPFFEISGTLNLPDGGVEVSGKAWMDREWSSQPLAEDQTGWDWFSLSFEDGAKMMGFLLRASGGNTYSSATWIEADGAVTSFPDGAFSAVAQDVDHVEGREIPTTWRARLPERGVDVVVKAINPNALMTTSVPYWEGPVEVSGSHKGYGYLEMTGY
ncbi:MAG: lipocalin-like domain-containing protein [Litoreibacter sp.]